MTDNFKPPALKSECAPCEILVSVAVSDAGTMDCCIAESPYIQQRNKHQQWMTEKRDSRLFWSIKTVKVAVPFPLSFEDMT